MVTAMAQMFTPTVSEAGIKARNDAVLDAILQGLPVVDWSVNERTGRTQVTIRGMDGSIVHTAWKTRFHLVSWLTRMTMRHRASQINALPVAVSGSL